MDPREGAQRTGNVIHSFLFSSSPECSLEAVFLLDKKLEDGVGAETGRVRKI